MPLTLKDRTLYWGDNPLCYVDIYTQKGKLPEVRLIVDDPDNPEDEPLQIIRLQTPNLLTPN